MIKVVEVKSQTQNTASSETLAVFVSDDAKSYDAVFTAVARRQLISLLQIEESRHLEAAQLSLTVKDHTVALSRQGNALVLVTTEVGPIAFHIPPEMIGEIQQALGQLARMPQRS